MLHNCNCFWVAIKQLELEQVRIPFDNYVSIVTFAAYRDNILFDGQPIVYISGGNTWDTNTIPGYAFITFHITHDFHYVNNAPGTTGSFAVYVYGHSILTTSSSAYGFSANYNSKLYCIVLYFSISIGLAVSASHSMNLSEAL